MQLAAAIEEAQSDDPVVVRDILANMKDYDLCINSDMGIDEIAQLIVKVYQNGKLWK